MIQLARMFVIILSCTLCVDIAGCTHNSEKVFAYKIALGTHSAITPVPQGYDGWWIPLHEAHIERIKQGNVDLLFIGDSITRHWESEKSSCCTGGYKTWQKYYAPRNAANIGISADRTQNILWRLDHLPLDKISPRLAIVLIGTNNTDKATFGEDNTAKEIGEGIIAVCQKLRRDLPRTKILLLAIFPRQDDNLSTKAHEASKLSSRIADNKWLFYLDMGDIYLDKNGEVKPELMPDGLHPNAQGYQVWAQAMEATISKLMQD